MITRRTLETAGFFTIAAALHVSAAAIMLPERLERGVAAEAPPAALAAGGEEIRSMVTEWEAPPEIEPEIEVDTATPDAQIPPEMSPEVASQPAPDLPVMAAAPSLMAPEPTPAQPNLPEPPEPIAPELEPIDPARLDLPDLQQMPPPEIETEPALTLTASARPDRRPEPQPEPEPRRAPAPQPDPEPQRQQAAPAEAAPRQAQPAQRAGAGGQAQASRPAGGGGGASAATQASAMTQWSAQINGCLARRLPRVTGGRGMRVMVDIAIGRDGRVQSVALAGGTGDPRLDSQIQRGIQRVGRCPGAPAALTDPVYRFRQPFTIG